MSNESITAKYLQDILTKIDGSKSAWPDGLHSKTGKPPAKNLMKTFIERFRAQLQERRLPANWLTSTVVAVREVRDRDNDASFRLVSLTFPRRKTLRRFCDWIVSCLEANKLVTIKQQCSGRVVHKG